MALGEKMFHKDDLYKQSQVNKLKELRREIGNKPIKTTQINGRVRYYVDGFGYIPENCNCLLKEGFLPSSVELKTVEDLARENREMRLMVYNNMIRMDAAEARSRKERIREEEDERGEYKYVQKFERIGNTDTYKPVWKRVKAKK